MKTTTLPGRWPKEKWAKWITSRDRSRLQDLRSQLIALGVDSQDVRLWHELGGLTLAYRADKPAVKAALSKYASQ